MARQSTAILLIAALLGASAQAQLLPGNLGQLPGQLPGQIAGGVVDPLLRDAPATIGGAVDTLSVRAADTLDRVSLRDLRRARLDALIRANRDVLEADADGQPVRRGEIIALDASPDLLVRLKAAGFETLRTEAMEELGLRTHVLGVPRGETARKALERARKLAPEGVFDLNHVFEPAGGALGGADGAAAAGESGASDVPIGMIDGGVAAHPALAGASIRQRGFAAGGPKGSGHGTAIASLLVGRDGAFKGAATGRVLLAADVYGGNPAAGSAELIAQALGWLVKSGAPVITVSLVGPPNQLLARAVALAQQRGVIVVAAVGNDGPAAPPMYPASYPGVIAVTGVDGRDRALLEAGRARHLDFAAPGADMVAALPGKGYGKVRGTSFAAPLVAARLAAAQGSPARRVSAVAGEAVKGKGNVGRGIVCKACRTVPATAR
ncbi:MULTISPECIES: S8 family serine peptidase [unclassified Sphingobium]|uniref:S8 family serine peptidase n=1 Tax=unclassified Sphingobium TaxID=2611147 RepID=UPI0022240B4C|nr:MULTISPECIES: S8 family serine peptidase [unclassified Sphingobium]MCW2395524.1 hypothetical protein [Sphingobium sp. B8D3B]MCW2419039.1 hypothetical protein [Sphingobium sp. B8D3C]